MSSILIKNASFNNVENCTEYSLLDNINKLVYNLKENKFFFYVTIIKMEARVEMLEKKVKSLTKK